MSRQNVSKLDEDDATFHFELTAEPGHDFSLQAHDAGSEK